MNPHENYDDPERPWGTAPDDAGGSLQIPAFVLDPFGVLKRRWPWMLATTLLGLAATAVVVSLWKPLYIAQATVLITSQQIPEDFIRSTVREDSIANINAMVGEVLSRENLARILKQYEPYSDFHDEAATPALIGRMRSRIQIASTSGAARGNASLVYGLSFQDEEPGHAAAIANALAALFIEASIARRNEQAQRTTAFLRRELEQDESELREQSHRLSEFRTANRGDLPSELNVNLRRLEVLSRDRDYFSNQIAQIESQMAELLAGGGSLAFSTSKVTKRVRSRLHGEGGGVTVLKLPGANSENELLLTELRRQLARELAAHTEDHPNVKSLRRKVQQQEQIVAEEPVTSADESEQVNLILRSEGARLGRLKLQQAQIETQRADLEERLDRMPIVAEQLAALEQKEKVLREDYLASLRKVEEAELAESLESAQQGAQVSMLDRAQPPSSPDRPRSHLLVGGVAATLALALGVAVLLELIDQVVVNPEQLEALAGRPVLGSLPRVA
jgi:uncharacterized protein involved in exopolysaccharide biosynthesis